MKNSTIPIVFHGGTYGTYLEWALFTLTNSSKEILNPLNENGNSHKFKGNHLGNFSGWEKYLDSPEVHRLVRFHPKTSKHESIVKNFNELGKSVDQFIYLYPDKHTLLLCLSNQYSKVWSSWWERQFNLFEIDPNKIYHNWPVQPGEQIPIWIQREFLSFYLMPMWFDQIEWDNTQQFAQPNCIHLSVYDLLFNFEYSIKQLSKKLNLSLIYSIDQILPIHINMISLQKNLGVDQLCKNIVESVIHNQFLEWNQISIVGESWIQWQLRNLGYEIECHSLDIFPTNSVQLQELIYKV